MRDEIGESRRLLACVSLPAQEHGERPGVNVERETLLETEL